MHTRFIIGLALAATFVAPVFAGSPAEPSFVGKWLATATAPTGKTEETVTVVKNADGYAITGKVAAPAPGQPEGSPGKDIVLEGDHFSYQRTVAIGTSEIVITYTGVVSGDTFNGTAEMGGYKVPYTGVRIKDGAKTGG